MGRVISINLGYKGGATKNFYEEGGHHILQAATRRIPPAPPPQLKMNGSLFECQCIKLEGTNWGHYFYFSYWRRDRHFTWSSEQREGLAICRAKAVLSFLSHFKTLSVGPVPGIEPATSRSTVKPKVVLLLLVSTAV